MQVLSGGIEGGVIIWEVHQQKLLARQHLDAGPSSVGDTLSYLLVQCH